MQKKKRAESELKNAVMRLKKHFMTVGIFSFFINLLMLVPPLYMLQLYDRVLTSRSNDTLIMLTLIVVILFITMALLEIVRSKVLVRLGNKLDLYLNSRVFDAVFEMSNKYPLKGSSQPLKDLNQIRQFMTGRGLFAFFDAPWLPIFIAVLFIFHPMFGYFAIFASLVLIAITFLNEYYTKSDLENANKENRQSMQFVDSNLRNSEVVHAMGMMPNIKEAWLNKHYKAMKSQTRASEKAGTWSNSAKVLRMMFQSLMLGLGGYLAINMEVSPGMMIAGSIIMGRALAPLDLLVGTWKGFSGARTSYRRLNDLLEEFPAQKDAMKLPDPKGEVTLENLVVVPPKAKKPSIMGLNMQINKGDIVGIIGPSAAGKSSLARALLGLWPLQNGKARIDKADISQWRREDLGKFIGYLPQDIELFEGTVAQNIARFDEVDSDKVVKAAQLAGVHEMILKLPDGYDSYISSASLSGGQKQRIGLARALYGDPVLVVLDEPNSNLDEAVEQALLQAVEQMKQNNTTVILITHKRNILRATSKLAFMVEGKLQMFGPTQNVLAKLAQKQNQGGQMQKNPQGQKNQGQNPNANAQQLRKPGEEQ